MRILIVQYKEYILPQTPSHIETPVRRAESLGGANSLFLIGFISKTTPWGLKLFITLHWGAKTTFSDFSVPPQGVCFLENHCFSYVL